MSFYNQQDYEFLRKCDMIFNNYFGLSSIRRSVQQDQFLELKSVKMNEQVITQCQTPPPQYNQIQTDQMSSRLKKIILSNEQMMKCQCEVISKLRKELEQMEKRCLEAEGKLSMMMESVGGDRNIIDTMVKRNSELQKMLSEQKVKWAVKQEQVESINFNNLKRIKSGNLDVGRQNLGKYFEIDAVRKDEDILNRRRKHSEDESAMLGQWNKLLEYYLEDQKMFKEKTISLVKKVIPHDLRTKVWPLVFDNKLAITNGLYIELLDRRNNKFINPKVASQIDKDLLRSFCGSNQFQNRMGLTIEVAEVLEIFHIYRPDVSYVQGMTYPMIVLVLVVGKIKAFRIFANIILGNCFYRRLFTFQSNYITIYCRAFDLLLKDQYPQLAQKLQTQNIQSEIFLIQWFFTLFSRGLSFEFTLKVWDLFAYYGELIHYRLALTILGLIGDRLLSTNYEETIGLIRGFCSYTQENKIFSALLNCKLTQQKLENALIKSKKQTL